MSATAVVAASRPVSLTNRSAGGAAGSSRFMVARVTIIRGRSVIATVRSAVPPGPLTVTCWPSARPFATAMSRLMTRVESVSGATRSGLSRAARSSAGSAPRTSVVVVPDGRARLDAARGEHRDVCDVGDPAHLVGEPGRQAACGVRAGDRGDDHVHRHLLGEAVGERLGRAGRAGGHHRHEGDPDEQRTAGGRDAARVAHRVRSRQARRRAPAQERPEPSQQGRHPVHRPEQHADERDRAAEDPDGQAQGHARTRRHEESEPEGSGTAHDHQHGEDRADPARALVHRHRDRRERGERRDPRGRPGRGERGEQRDAGAHQRAGARRRRPRRRPSTGRGTSVVRPSTVSASCTRPMPSAAPVTEAPSPRTSASSSTPRRSWPRSAPTQRSSASIRVRWATSTWNVLAITSAATRSATAANPSTTPVSTDVEPLSSAAFCAARSSTVSTSPILPPSRADRVGHLCPVRTRRRGRRSPRGRWGCRPAGRPATGAPRSRRARRARRCPGRPTAGRAAR